MTRLPVRRALAPLLLLAALACSVEVANAAFSRSSLATRGAETLYHYGFSTAADDIAKQGLRPGISSGKVFTTPRGDLSPLQAQIDLALPPNRGLPDALFEIDVPTLRRMGIDVPASTPVYRNYNMPGGGLENVFDVRIPPEAIRRVR